MLVIITPLQTAGHGTVGNPGVVLSQAPSCVLRMSWPLCAVTHFTLIYGLRSDSALSPRSWGPLVHQPHTTLSTGAFVLLHVHLGIGSFHKHGERDSNAICLWITEDRRKARRVCLRKKGKGEIERHLLLQTSSHFLFPLKNKPVFYPGLSSQVRIEGNPNKGF